MPPERGESAQINSGMPTHPILMGHFSPDTLRNFRLELLLNSSPAETSFPGSSAGASILSGMSSALSVRGSSVRDPVSNKSEGLRTARWVKRQLLTRAPKTAEEIALDDKEVRG